MLTSRKTQTTNRKRLLTPGSEGVSPAEMAAKMAALPGKGGGK